MNAQTKIETTLEQVARDCYDKSGGDVRKATDMLEQTVRNDDALFRQAMEPLVRNACYTMVSKTMRTERKRIWTAPNYVEPSVDKKQGARVKALAEGTLMMFPLANGLKLRDATLQDVQDAAERYRMTADDMAHKGRWLAAIANKLPEGKKVVDVFDEMMLNELKDQASV